MALIFEYLAADLSADALCMINIGMDPIMYYEIRMVDCEWQIPDGLTVIIRPSSASAGAEGC